VNPAQLYEIELNFLSNNIARVIKDKSLLEKEKILFEFIEDINPTQAKYLKIWYEGLDDKKQKKFFKDIDKYGIFLHQPPFWGNIGFDRLREIYKKYNWIKPYKCFINGKEIEKPLIVGEKYLMKLRHESQNKFSARSTSYLNIKNSPSKSMSYKRHQSLYSQTPIRLGEMEITNLLLTMNPIIGKMISMYSGFRENRYRLIEHLLTGDKLIDVIKLEKPFENHNKKILKVYLKSLGVKLK